MAVGADTYAHDLIALCGGQNVFARKFRAASRRRAKTIRWRERRYPLVTRAEIAAARPEVILLPDEPYAFGARDVAELAALAHTRRGRPAASTASMAPGLLVRSADRARDRGSVRAARGAGPPV